LRHDKKKIIREAVEKMVTFC